MTSDRRLMIYNWVSAILPECAKVHRLRIWMLRWAGVVVGKNCRIASTAKFKGRANISIGDNVVIRDGAFIQATNNSITIENGVTIAEKVILEAIPCGTVAGSLLIGEGSDVMQYTILSANGNANVKIGKYCKIAHNVSVKATHHPIVLTGNCIGGDSMFSDIEIGDGCWLCASSTIIPNVKVGEKCVVAAGAVVTHDVPPYSLVAGVPAVVKKSYRRKE